MKRMFKPFLPALRGEPESKELNVNVPRQCFIDSPPAAASSLLTKRSTKGNTNICRIWVFVQNGVALGGTGGVGGHVASAGNAPSAPGTKTC